MLNNRLHAAKMVADNLVAVEAAIDEALVCASDLTAATVKARTTANLSAVVGQDAVASTGSAIAALHEARAQIIAAHRQFAQVRTELGLTPRMTGDLWKFVGEADEEVTAIRGVA